MNAASALLVVNIVTAPTRAMSAMLFVKNRFIVFTLPPMISLAGLSSPPTSRSARAI